MSNHLTFYLCIIKKTFHFKKNMLKRVQNSPCHISWVLFTLQRWNEFFLYTTKIWQIAEHKRIKSNVFEGQRSTLLRYICIQLFNVAHQPFHHCFWLKISFRFILSNHFATISIKFSEPWLLFRGPKTPLQTTSLVVAPKAWHHSF